MKPEKKIINILMPGLLLFVLCALIACASGLATYRGKTADPKSRIALKGGSHNGEWQTEDLKVKYSYSRNPNNLRITGDVELKYHMMAGSEIVERFVLEVSFLNASAKVLDTKELAISGFREAITKWDFDHTFQLPAGTAAIAFSYDGQMGADRAGGDSPSEFWYEPFK